MNGQAEVAKLTGTLLPIFLVTGINLTSFRLFENPVLYDYFLTDG
jgi:hypothetical protein